MPTIEGCKKLGGNRMENSNIEKLLLSKNPIQCQCKIKISSKNMADHSNNHIQEPKIKKRKPLRIDLTAETENEEQKLLRVLAILLNKTENKNEKEIKGDSVDGITDSIVSIADKLSELLECNFDTLDLPKTIIKSLKILKAITDIFKAKTKLEVFRHL